MTFKRYMEEEFDKEISVEDEIVKAMKELEKKPKKEMKKHLFGASIKDFIEAKR